MTVRLDGARLASRTTDVTRAGVIMSSLLERELDLLAIIVQELRRDLNDVGPDVFDAAAAAIHAATNAVADVEGALSGLVSTATSAAGTATAAASAAAESAAAAGLFDPSSYYPKTVADARYFQKTEFKADGTPNTPVIADASGIVTGKFLYADNSALGAGAIRVVAKAGSQALAMFCDGATPKWQFQKAADNSFSLYGYEAGTNPWSVTPAGVVAFAASPLVPTPAAGDNSTKAANTAFVTAAVANVNAVSKDNGAGAVGTILLAWVSGSAAVAVGATVAGSGLQTYALGIYAYRYSDSNDNSYTANLLSQGTGTALTGTWRNVQSVAVPARGAGIFQRIA